MMKKMKKTVSKSTGLEDLGRLSYSVKGVFMSWKVNVGKIPRNYQAFEGEFVIKRQVISERKTAPQARIFLGLFTKISPFFAYFLPKSPNLAQDFN